MAGVSSLTVSDMVEYHTAVMADRRWEMDNSALLDIDSQCGVVVARMAGSASVKFKSSSSPGEGTMVWGVQKMR